MDKTINNNRVTMRDLYSLAERLDEKIDSLSNQIANLPCKLHEFRISNLEKVREKNCNETRNKQNRWYQRKTEIIAALIGALVSLGIIWATNIGGIK